MNKYSVLAIVPARGGSKGLFRKNIKILCGKPLLYYSIKAGCDSEYIDRVIVSTEDNEIEKIAKEYQAEVVKRPDNLSKDNTPSLFVFQQVIDFLSEKEQYIPDIIVILQPTSPLRAVTDVDSSIEKLINEQCDSVITVKKVHHPPQWMLKLDEKGRIENVFGNDNIIQRQQIGNIYSPNGAIYVSWTDVIMNKNTLRGPDTRALIMPDERSIDIDTELDFFIAEKLLMEYGIYLHKE